MTCSESSRVFVKKARVTPCHSSSPTIAEVGLEPDTDRPPRDGAGGVGGHPLDDLVDGAPVTEAAGDRHEDASLTADVAPLPEVMMTPHAGPIGDATGHAADADADADAATVAEPEAAPGLAADSDAHADAATVVEPEAAPGLAAESDADADVAPVVEPETAPVVRSTVAEAIAEALAHAGARLAFTVPGESFLPLLDALPAAGIRVVTARHEGGAAFMAEAAAQLSGRPQVVLATRTVGAANAAIGIHTARQDSAPLVALIGQVRRSIRGREAFQESDLATGIGSLAKWAGEIGSAERAMRLVAEGLRELSHGRPGPILLSLPEDLLGLAITTPGAVAPPVAPVAPDRAAVRQVLRWLAASERGVIFAGGGVLHAKSSRRLTALSETLAVPVIASWRRPDVIPNDHPHYLGMSGYWAPSTVRQRLIDADVVLVLGARLSEVATFGYRIPGTRSRWAHVDLEPRAAMAGLHAPTLAVAADVARFLDACFGDLRGVVLDAEMRGRRVVGIEADRAAYLAASTVDDGEWEGPGVHPGRIIATLQRLLPANAILTSDAGNFAGWATRGYRFTRPGTFLGPTSGAMGYGLPAAIAASLLHPDRVVVALAGDGGFAMTMSELETAVRSGARPIVLVFDNAGYGTIRMHQAREGRSSASSELGAIDFAAVATASGALGLRVEDDAAFEPALATALAAGRPAVIHMALDPRWVSVDQRP